MYYPFVKPFSLPFEPHPRFYFAATLCNATLLWKHLKGHGKREKMVHALTEGITPARGITTSRCQFAADSGNKFA